MSKQKITEQELFAKIAKLQEQIDQSVEEGWWGDNMPELLGGDPAKAPMKLPKTPKNYARIEKMLPAMYAAAQVDPGADEIVKQRFGVYLPPYEQWDGTVPSGRGDFLTRNVFGRDGAAAAEAEGTKAQQAEVARQQRVEANAKKLTDLYAQLKELVPGAFAEKTAAPVAKPTAVATPVKESLAESMKRLSLMITEQEEVRDTTNDTGSTETPGAEHPAEAVIKEIEATIAAIEADDPDEDDLQVINAVKEKIAQSREVIKQETKTAKPQAAAAPAAGEANDQAAADARQDAEQSSIAAQQQQAAEPASAGGSTPDAAAAPAAASAPAAVPGASQVATTAQNMINTTWKQIYDLNKSIIGNNPNLIKPGQKFELPNGMGSYTVVPGDTLSGIAAGQGKGKYETNVPPQPPKPPVPTQPTFTPKATGDYYKLPGAPLKSTNGTYKNLDVSDPKIKALQAKVANDPNNASFNATVREDQTLARIVSLVNYNK